MYNKEDARNLYFSVVKDGLWRCQGRIERLLHSEEQYKAKCKEMVGHITPNTIIF